MDVVVVVVGIIIITMAPWTMDQRHTDTWPKSKHIGATRFAFAPVRETTTTNSFVSSSCFFVNVLVCSQISSWPIGYDESDFGSSCSCGSLVSFLLNIFDFSLPFGEFVLMMDCQFNMNGIQHGSNGTRNTIMQTILFTFISMRCKGTWMTIDTQGHGWSRI